MWSVDQFNGFICLIGEQKKKIYILFLLRNPLINSLLIVSWIYFFFCEWYSDYAHKCKQTNKQGSCFMNWKNEVCTPQKIEDCRRLGQDAFSIFLHSIEEGQNTVPASWSRGWPSSIFNWADMPSGWLCYNYMSTFWRLTWEIKIIAATD